MLAIFRKRTMLQALLIAEFDAAEVEHAVLHGGKDALTAAGAVTLIKRCNNAEREMQAGS